MSNDVKLPSITSSCDADVHQSLTTAAIPLNKKILAPANTSDPIASLLPNDFNVKQRGGVVQ